MLFLRIELLVLLLFTSFSKLICNLSFESSCWLNWQPFCLTIIKLNFREMGGENDLKTWVSDQLMSLLGFSQPTIVQYMIGLCTTSPYLVI